MERVKRRDIEGEKENGKEGKREEYTERREESICDRRWWDEKLKEKVKRRNRERMSKKAKIEIYGKMNRNKRKYNQCVKIFVHSTKNFYLHKNIFLLQNN